MEYLRQKRYVFSDSHSLHRYVILLIVVQMPGENTTKPLSFELDDDGYAEPRSKNTNIQIQVIVSDRNLELLGFYRDIIAPFIESYWITSTSLLSLLHRQSDYSLYAESLINNSKDKLRLGLLCFRKKHVSP